MKATDLRIGSIVHCYDQVCAVIAICDTTPTLRLPSGNSTIVPLDLIDPIPLTEEWMVRAGFDCTWSGQGEGQTWELKVSGALKISLHGDFWPLYFDYLGKGMWMYGAKIEFVHQLQNLYHALTGEELEFIPKG